jgi:hypothetical protein
MLVGALWVETQLLCVANCMLVGARGGTPGSQGWIKGIDVLLMRRACVANTAAVLLMCCECVANVLLRHLR